MNSICNFFQLCTVDLEIRELERETVGIFPERVLMESETVLVQYIISDWSLFYRFVVLKSECSRGFLLTFGTKKLKLLQKERNFVSEILTSNFEMERVLLQPAKKVSIYSKFCSFTFIFDMERVL